VSSAPLLFTIDQEPINSTRVLLCEGSGDKSFFKELIRIRALPEFYITHPIDKLHDGGRRGFSQRLRALKLQPGFDAVRGIIVTSDNDNNPDASFREVRALIHDAGYNAPNHPFVINAGPPAITVMMIPAPDETGQLETLCLAAIRDAWPLQFRCAEAYAGCVGIGTWTTGKQERAKLRALISHICKKDPNSSLTHVWSDGREVVIPLDRNCFDHIAAFLNGFDAAIAMAGA
jgi:hypothetical protein